MPKIIASLFLLLLVSGGCQHHQQQGSAIVRAMPEEFDPARGPQNVILMIGDGMGLSQITAALYSNDEQLNLAQFPIVGLQKSYSADNLITDSAAAASALACGVKTYNGAVGVNRDTIPVPSILEEARLNGLATGVITTSTIVHATPAGFLAHQPDRDMYEEIAVDVTRSGADLLIGGGKKFFDQRTKDFRNLCQELANNDYLVSDFLQTDFNELIYSAGKGIVFFTSNGDPQPFAKGRDYLVPAVRMAPPFLEERSRKGFFLMVEGAQIDWGGHSNDLEMVIQETLEFDRAIGEVLKYAKEDGRTLVIVTGDHETGGLALVLGSKMNEVKGAFATDYHTGVLIPVFAYGPGAELFGGIYENTDIPRKMRQVFRFPEEGKMLGKR